MRNFRFLGLVILFVSPTQASEIVDWKDLVERNGIYYQKIDETLFTGQVDGARERGHIREGKKDGLWVSYWNNGELRAQGSYKGGKKEGPWISYQSNGEMWKKGSYSAGERDGSWVIYQSKGEVW